MAVCAESARVSRAKDRWFDGKPPMLRLILLTLSLVLSTGCQTMPELLPLDPVDHVDLSRFMGDWYVIAHIPTFLEKEAHNAVESYELGRTARSRRPSRFAKAASTAR